MNAILTDDERTTYEEASTAEGDAAQAELDEGVPPILTAFFASPYYFGPELIAHLDEIEACHSTAGDAAYMLFVRVATPRDLERLIRDIRSAASVNTRTTVVLQTVFEHRPLSPA